MAIQHMGFEVAATTGVEILYNSDYVGKAITLDSAAFTNEICKAGTPISAAGAVANSASALGILLHDVHQGRPQGTIVIGGYINTAAAQKHSGVTVSEDAKAAMKNVVFC
jgi:hypothetical protein